MRKRYNIATYSERGGKERKGNKRGKGDEQIHTQYVRPQGPTTSPLIYKLQAHARFLNEMGPKIQPKRRDTWGVA
jgi:hypothetical protein